MQKIFVLRSSLFFISLLLFGGIDLGYFADDKIYPNLYFPTHKDISKPLPIKDTGYLLVSLEKYLGKNGLYNSQSRLLNLISNGSPLILQDSNGLVHKSSKITIGWRNVQLESPKTVSRQVIGPFSSFESAQRIAVLLDQDGIENVIAHPSDWEIWVSNKIKLPKGLKFSLFEEKLLNKLQPFLKLDSGTFLLSGDIKINAPDGLLWKKGLYSGPFLLKPDAYGTWTFIEKVPVEKYLLGVLPHEMGRNSPLAALSAQAVLARTWAIANSHRFEIDGYHLCSDTQCQVYKDPRLANESVRNAITNTAGMLLKWGNKPIHAVYHASNGGVSADIQEAWSMDSVPYLRAKLDGNREWQTNFSLPLSKTSDVSKFLASSKGVYGKNHPRFRWARTVTDKEIKIRLYTLSEFLKNYQKNQIPQSFLSND